LSIAKLSSPSAAIEKGYLGVGRGNYAAIAKLLFLAFIFSIPVLLRVPQEKETRLAYIYSKPLSKPVHPLV